jgi:hypothetical protein
MVIARRAFELRQALIKRLAALASAASGNFLCTVLLVGVLLVSGGCGQTVKPVISPAVGQVDTYFGGPFLVFGSNVHQSASAFDHLANQIAVSGFIIEPGNHQVPVNLINGTFASAETGFLSITETFAPNSSVPSTQNPSLTGAWAVEIPGAGALANLLSVNTSTTPAIIRAAPTAMAQNTTCPNSSMPIQFLYVTVPYVTVLPDMADYGIVGISSQGSAVTLNAQPFFVGSQAQPPSAVTGGCSQTIFGALTAYPLNSFGSPSNVESISIGSSGLLVSSFNPGPGGASTGAFGGGTGVIGVAVPSSPVNLSSVVAAQYNGFIFSPDNPVKQSYDITVLASAFGNDIASSQACSALQASLAANNGQGAGTVPVLPSANSIYGGEFLTMSGAGSVNDPTGASGSENCDVVIDLGTQDSSNNGLFPNATVFIGSTFPPFGASNPWGCNGGACAVSFPAAAIVGQVNGQFVIFVSASGVSSPPAQLPDGSGILQPQPVGIYLFQKM